MRCPPAILALDKSLKKFSLAVFPTLFYPIIVLYLPKPGESTFAFDGTEDVILMVSIRPIKSALLSGGFDATGDDRGDVNVKCRVRIGVVVYMEGDGRIADGFADKPGYALLRHRSKDALITNAVKDK